MVRITNKSSPLMRIYSNSRKTTKHIRIHSYRALARTAIITNFTLAAYQPDDLSGILRYLVSGPAWHLDAFSASQLPTWLPSNASDETTGTP